MTSRFWRAGSNNAISPNCNVLADAVSTATTWAAATDWTLTNTNLTAERTATANFWSLLHSTFAKTTFGRVDVTVNAIASASYPGRAVIGVGTGGETQYPGQDPSGYGAGYAQTGEVFWANDTIATVASYTTGDVIGVERPNADTVKFYKNGTLVYTLDLSDPAHNPSGVLRTSPGYIVVANGNTIGLKVTADFSGW